MQSSRHDVPLSPPTATVWRGCFLTFAARPEASKWQLGEDEPMDHQLQASIRAAVLAAPDEYARAVLLYELTRTVYDTVKMAHADRGRADTPERSGIGAVIDIAGDHRAHMAVAHHQTIPADTIDDPEDLFMNDPTEAFQHQVTAPLGHDNTAVQLTVYQAEKCAATIHAYLDGQTLFEKAVRDIAQLLTVRAIQASGIPSAATDPWPRIEALPWPPPRGLRPTSTE